MDCNYWVLPTRRCNTSHLKCRQRRHFGNSIPEFGETHSSVLGCERRPFSASIISRSCFASFPVCVYKCSNHYLNKIIFIDNSLGPLAWASPCIYALLSRCAYYTKIKFNLYVDMWSDTTVFTLPLLKINNKSCYHKGKINRVVLDHTPTHKLNLICS
jgi:hypothetical protein